MRLGWRELDDLAGLAMPELVLHGSADRVLPVAHARSLADGIRNSRLIVVEGMGHLPTRTECTYLAGVVAAFLNGTVS